MYAQYAAACATRPQAKLAQFTDSGGKPVTVYGSNGCGLTAPENNAKYAAGVASKALGIVGAGIVAHEVAGMVTDVSKMSGTQINASADGESAVTINAGDGSFNEGAIEGGISIGNTTITDTTTVSNTNTTESNTDSKNDLP